VNCLPVVDTLACGVIIQEAIDQACAQKDREIAAVRKAFDDYRNAHGENMAQYPKALERLAAMSAILEKVEHVALRAIPPDSDSLHWDGITPGCHPDCPACQYEAMKAKK
jgi:antirestriction protein